MISLKNKNKLTENVRNFYDRLSTIQNLTTLVNFLGLYTGDLEQLKDEMQTRSDHNLINYKKRRIVRIVEFVNSMLYSARKYKELSKNKREISLLLCLITAQENIINICRKITSNSQLKNRQIHPSYYRISHRIIELLMDFPNLLTLPEYKQIAAAHNRFITLSTEKNNNETPKSTSRMQAIIRRQKELREIEDQMTSGFESLLATVPTSGRVFEEEVKVPRDFFENYQKILRDQYNLFCLTYSIINFADQNTGYIKMFDVLNEELDNLMRLSNYETKLFKNLSLSIMDADAIAYKTTELVIKHLIQLSQGSKKYLEKYVYADVETWLKSGQESENQFSGKLITDEIFWSDKWRVHIAVIDQGHQKIIKLGQALNTLVHRQAEDKASFFTAKEQQLLTFLQEQTFSGFKIERQFLEQFNWFGKIEFFEAQKRFLLLTRSMFKKAQTSRGRDLQNTVVKLLITYLNWLLDFSYMCRKVLALSNFTEKNSAVKTDQQDLSENLKSTPVKKTADKKPGGRPNLFLLTEKLAVCRASARAPLPRFDGFGSHFFSITRTRKEMSVVCLENEIPSGFKAERDWRAIMIGGPLEFEIVGLMASLSVVLAKAGVSIFVISTYDTDYLLIKDGNVDRACAALEAAGWKFADNPIEGQG